MAVKPNSAPVTHLPTEVTEVFPAGQHTMEAITALSRHVKFLEASFEQLKLSGDVVHLALAFTALSDIHDRLDAMSKVYGKIWDVARSETIPSAFEDAKVDKSLSLTTGRRVTVSTRWYAGFRKDKKLEGFEWLRSNDQGSLIYETVNSQTLASTAKYFAEEMNKEFPDDVFNVEQRPSASVVKGRAASS